MTEPAKPSRRHRGTGTRNADKARGAPSIGLPAFEAAVADGASPEALAAALERDFEGLALDCWARELEALNSELGAAATDPALELAQCSDAASDPFAPIEQGWWICVQGPLVDQAEAIAALKVLAKLPGVAVNSHLIEVP